MIEIGTPLEAAWYGASAAFRSIALHAAVCVKGTGELVAVTGPAEDEEAQHYAEFFAATPEFVEAVSALEQEWRRHGAELRHDMGSQEAVVGNWYLDRADELAALLKGVPHAPKP